MPDGDREQLLQLASAAVRMLGAAVTAPAPAVVTEQVRRRAAVWRYG